MVRNLYDIGAVWLVTLTASLGTPVLITMPEISGIATLISVFLAIAFTIYRFYSEIKRNRKRNKK